MNLNNSVSFFGNSTSPRPCADAWCVFELDGGNPPLLIDSFGINGVTRVQTGVSRVNFTNPERFQNGAYIGLVQTEAGNPSADLTIGIIQGTTLDDFVYSTLKERTIGASASCDILNMVFLNTTPMPSFLSDSANSHKIRYNAAFFSLRSDNDLYRPYLANHLVYTENLNNGILKLWGWQNLSVQLSTLKPPSKISGTNVFKIVPDAGISVDTSTLKLSQTATVNSGKYYTVSGYFRAGELNQARIKIIPYFDSANPLNEIFSDFTIGSGPSITVPAGSGWDAAKSVSSFENAGNGWYRYILTGYWSGSDISKLDIRIAGGNLDSSLVNGNRGIYVCGLQLNEGSFAPEYIPNDTDSIKFGNQEQLVRFHPGVSGFGQYSSQNLLKQSQTFTSPWSLSRLGISAGGYTAPDGTTTAIKLYELDPTSGTQYKYIQQQLGTNGMTVGNGTFTFSIFAKAAERNHIAFTDSVFGKFGRLVVDLRTGAISENEYSFGFGDNSTRNSTPLNVYTKYYENGWWRIAATIATPPYSSSGHGNVFGFAPNNGATVGVDGADTVGYYGPSYEGVSGSGILIWGAQLERGNILSEYAATTTNPVGTTFTSVYGATYASTQINSKSKGEATAWGTIVIPPIPNSNTIPSAYLESAKGVSKIVSKTSGVYDVYFTKPMSSSSYCVITSIEQESYDPLTSGIPSPSDFALTLIKDSGSVTNSERRRDKFSVSVLRQNDQTKNFEIGNSHSMNGKLQKIHFIVFGGRASYGTA